MKLKVGKMRIDSKTLIEMRRDGLFPKLYVHERFERPLKWVIWSIAILSFITIFITVDNYYVSVSIGLILFGLSFIFDRAIVKHTVVVVQPFPEFKVDYGQWINVMTVSKPDYKKNVNFVGFVYKDIEYGNKFFAYLKGWNFGEADDKDRNIILSIVEEVDGGFTFYVYANPNRKNLGDMYNEVELDKFLTKSKEGKLQEQIIMEMAYWHTIHYTNNKHMRDFLKNQPTNEKLMFVPTQKTAEGYAIGLESQIILHGYTYSKRVNLPKDSRENQLSEMAKKWETEEE